MKKTSPKPLPRLKITPELEQLLALALHEDVGPGDVTSQATIPETQKGEGVIFAKSGGVLCGIDVARAVLRRVDPRVRMTVLVTDGTLLQPKQEIARLKGSMRSILTAERLMLNFLQQLSGVATLTHQYVEALRKAGSPMDVVDTRKTTPLWRALERHAVRAGGGVNHRFALYDMYLVKNNHVDAAGGMAQALARIHADNKKRKLPVAVEARNLAEVRAILEQGADLILLDNMSPADMRKAADLIAGRARTEITGGVRLHHIPALAKLPIDRVSIGSLTHSAPALDIALHVRAAQAPRRPS